MPLTRQQKEERVQEMSHELTEAVSYVFMTYDALPVTDVEELRDNLHAQGVRLRVMSKRLLQLVMKNAEVDYDPVTQAGQLAVVWGKDPVAPAKVLYEFAKTRENIQLVAGVMEGEVLSSEQVLALAQLPSREQLLGQLLSVMAGPSRGLVVVLSGVQRNFVYALQAIAESKQ